MKIYSIFPLFSVKKYVKEEIGFWSEADTNEIAKSWLKFCNTYKNLVKVMEYDVPEYPGVCPKNMKLSLSDIKVTNYFKFSFNFKYIPC